MAGKGSIFARLTQAGGRLRVQNALNPILWLNGIVFSGCCAVFAFNPNAPLLILILPAVALAAALFGFVWLLVKDPDRLQSEEYLLRQRIMDVIEDKATRKAIDASLVRIINPDEFLGLPTAEQEEEESK